MLIQIDRDIYSGTAKEIVMLMKGGSIFTEFKGKDDYMQAVASRVDALTDQPVRTDSARIFINDLIKVGVAKRLR